MNNSPKNKTGLVYSEEYLKHDTGKAALYLPEDNFLEGDIHVENAKRILRTKNLLERTGLMSHLHLISPHSASIEDILACHDKVYMENVRATCAAGGGDAGLFTPLCPHSYDIALLAAGGVLTAVDAVMNKQVTNVYALVRPPGHHASGP